MIRYEKATYKRLAIVFCVFVSSLTFSQQNIYISEFMALNQSGITDEDGEYSDWIEIHNPTNSSVNLSGWSLTDDPEIPKKWIFPDLTIHANSYKIVFASGKNRVDPSVNIHLNFRLSGTGEYLALINSTGAKISEFSLVFPEQYTDHSYGYFNGDYIFFTDATPGSSNLLSTSKIVPAPTFDKHHGFYDSPINVTITCALSGTQIYYTTDGSAPNNENGNLYSSPVNISKTTILRAVATTTDNEYSKVYTQTYLYTGDIIHQPNNPAGYPDTWGPYTEISGTAIADYEIDPEMVADSTFASSLQEALKDLPIISLVTNKEHLFSHETNEQTGGIYIYTGTPVGDPIGKGWERPVSFEIFDTDTLSLQMNCGLRLHGGHSRLPEKSPKHSFRLVFKSEYGPSRFNYPLFGEDAAKSFNSITLRAGFGNSWIHHSHEERQRSQYQRDIWTKDTQRDLGHPSGNSIYVHLFVNGMYWGIYAPSERMDADFAANYLEGQPEDFDVIKDYSEAVDGEMSAWNSLLSAVDDNIKNNTNYLHIQGKNPDGSKNPELMALVDVDNLIDYMLINFYGGNTDWDHHNWAAMRNRTDPGNGFKFFCWDNEHMVKQVDQNVTNEFNDGCPSYIFQRLTENDEFKRRVADRAQKHFYDGGMLTPEKNIERWNKRAIIIENAIIAESARWGDYRRDVHQHQQQGPFELYSKEDHWLPQRDFMLNTYFPQRTSVFIEQLRGVGLFPNVDAPVFMVNSNETSGGKVSNGDILSMSTNQGTIYYTTSGSDPVEWTSEPSTKETVLIQASAAKKALVPTSDIGTTWRASASYNDDSWRSSTGSPGGVGYENSSGYQSYISIDVEDAMTDGSTSNPNTSCYIRIPFTVDEDDLSTFTTLNLYMRYDDGFIAYINGTKVAEINAPGTPEWNSSATTGNEANSAVDFTISQYINTLQSGENILAIHGLNLTTTSSDFLILPTLVASDQSSGGVLTTDAIAYSGEINIDRSLNIKARAFYNNQWSALKNSFFMIPDEYNYLKITEIHYHPVDIDSIDDSKFEFIEIKNTGTSTINMSGVQFVDGIEYTFPEDTPLEPGEFIVLASEDIYFYDLFGFMPFDEYKGQLNNDGEWIKVTEPTNGDTIISLRYNDGELWPTGADGQGFTLVPTELNPVNDQTLPEYWRRSLYYGGSPGLDDIEGNYVLPVEDVQTIITSTLRQNYPNPFSERTYIDYQLANSAKVNLSIYNMMGQKLITLVDTAQIPGLYQVEWNKGESGLNLSKGIYFYRLEVKSANNIEVFTKKMFYTE